MKEPIRALIVPHAGYIYSGQVAADAFRYLKSQADRIHRVILIGPCHRIYVAGCALPAVDSFSTPLGEVPLDTAFIEKVKTFNEVEVSDQAHAFEHCLEVQLPFLQVCLEPFTLLPLLVGDISSTAVAKLLDAIWQDDQTLLVVSSDLSHYHTYRTAQEIDRDTCTLIEQLEPLLTPEQACGATGINALLRLMKQRGYHLQRISLKNSGDTAGDKQSVVGYVSYLISES
jgi:AmmeMemoRadiSam system protein B